jgi:hypothetical protein
MVHTLHLLEEMEDLGAIIAIIITYSYWESGTILSFIQQILIESPLYARTTEAMMCLALCSYFGGGLYTATDNYYNMLVRPDA